ncbi:TetR/AcrR family transcriptional regulator [Sphingobium yanoikuyae]|nr:TetR/AcrR family transcriptional regulator [Sphingobium yanoikuyae]
MSESVRKRKPRRTFDRELGVERAQRIFHEKGYDGVSVADLTAALDINPPSLYAAYGSKAGLFEHTLRRYTAEQSLPASAIFEGRDLGDAIAQLFVSAANQYSQDATCRGCLVTEGARAADPEARNIAEGFSVVMASAISEEIVKRAPDQGAELADVVITMVRGLSAAAFTGVDAERLRATAEKAGVLIKTALTATIAV